MNEQVSEILILQRIRNRVIEVLELFSEKDSNELSYDLIENWADFVNSEKPEHFATPVFSLEEQELVKKVHQAWDKIDMEEPITSVNWSNLNIEAKAAFTIFMRRGFMSEHVENA